MSITILLRIGGGVLVAKNKLRVNEESKEHGTCGSYAAKSKNPEKILTFFSAIFLSFLEIVDRQLRILWR